MGDGGALCQKRIGEAPAFERLIGQECGVELELALARLLDDDANLVVADFDDVRLCFIGHGFSFAGRAGVLLIICYIG